METPEFENYEQGKKVVKELLIEAQDKLRRAAALRPPGEPAGDRHGAADAELEAVLLAQGSGADRLPDPGRIQRGSAGPGPRGSVGHGEGPR